MENGDIILERAKDGNYTCKVKLIDHVQYIYSKYEPIKTVNIPKVKFGNNYIVLGLGLGYELDEILKNTDGKIIVIEKNSKFLDTINCIRDISHYLTNNRLKLLFENEYKNKLTLELENFEIIENKNLVSLYPEYYKEFINYLNSILRKNSKKIVFFEHITIADDAIEALKKLKYNVVKKEWLPFEKMEFEIIKENPKFVFSINFSKMLSEICKKNEIDYISWTVDTPAYSLYSESVLSNRNYFFVYDASMSKDLVANGVSNVWYMPVAANVDRIDEVLPTPNDIKKYRADISFVGNTGIDNEFNNYIEKKLSNKTRNIISGILTELINDFNVDFSKIISDEFVEIIEEEAKIKIIPEKFMSKKDKFCFYIAKKLNELQRVYLLKSISQKFTVNVYGDKNWENISDNRIKYCGYAEHFKEMPLVFKLSKININFVRNYVKEGMPMRIFDILASGGFLVTNYNKDIEKYFVDGEDLVFFRNFEELNKIIEYYLSNEIERRKIAISGYEKVKNYHTYEKRISEIMSKIQ